MKKRVRFEKLNLKIKINDHKIAAQIVLNIKDDFRFIY